MTNQGFAGCYSFESFRFGPATGELIRDGRALKLLPQTSLALKLLISRGGELVTRNEFRDALWPDRRVASVHKGGIIYFGAQYVLKSTDLGQSWTPISPDLTRNREAIASCAAAGGSTAIVLDIRDATDTVRSVKAAGGIELHLPRARRHEAAGSDARQRRRSS